MTFKNKYTHLYLSHNEFDTLNVREQQINNPIADDLIFEELMNFIALILFDVFSNLMSLQKFRCNDDIGFFLSNPAIGESQAPERSCKFIKITRRF